jgi:toxin FitB
VETGFAERVIPVTLRIAAEWGRQRREQPIPVIDALIAATATVHGWIVVTRNARDFERTGVRVHDPFTA